MEPPALERELGLGAYLTPAPGIGGILRSEVEDFQVIELGPGPRPRDGKLAAARIRLRNWETNRFVGKAAQRLNVKRGSVAFAGMKDKRAVTEQWFTFPCHSEKVAVLEELDDVQVLEVRRTDQRHYAGAHDGNRFVLRVRDHNGDRQSLEANAAVIAEQAGVPQFFGPQRFGSGVRPITHLMGKAFCDNDLDEAVRLYCGHPMDSEPGEAQRARKIFEETGDAGAALDAFPERLDLERNILHRLARGDGPKRALQALPSNLLTLFLHAWQSYAFNHILTARLEAGMGLNTAHVGDRVMPMDDDGVTTTLVTAANRSRVQEELDKGRAQLTAILPGLTAEFAAGQMGEIEREVMDRFGMAPRQFRIHDMPSLASPGRRRAILQRVDDLRVDWVEGDPVVGFGLGKGAYATVVMREFMKSDITAY